ncbi:MAG: DUF4248 domain-containing protein [Prevotella sp.]|nr:DUF4248 domain-containing protein [Prevotella sp.]
MNTNRTYKRAELAALYFPDITPQAAWRKLRGWICLNPQLRRLDQTGRRSFTPAEVTLIFVVLGEPDCT